MKRLLIRSNSENLLTFLNILSTFSRKDYSVKTLTYKNYVLGVKKWNETEKVQKTYSEFVFIELLKVIEKYTDEICILEKTKSFVYGKKYILCNRFFNIWVRKN